MRTIGISPKVYLPGIGQIILGVGLILAKLPVEGKTMIATGLATFGIGYTASPGQVELTLKRPDSPIPDPVPAKPHKNVPPRPRP